MVVWIQWAKKTFYCLPFCIIYFVFAHRMYGEETTAYDPIFFLHHSFVDKVFADWQDFHQNEQRQNLNKLSDEKILPPFDNERHNKFMHMTKKTSRETWDYGQLCYCYDCDLPKIEKHDYGGEDVGEVEDGSVKAWVS